MNNDLIKALGLDEPFSACEIAAMPRLIETHLPTQCVQQAHALEIALKITFSFRLMALHDVEEALRRFDLAVGFMLEMSDQVMRGLEILGLLGSNLEQLKKASNN